MSLGQLAFKTVVRAAIRTTGFTGAGDIQKHAWMRVPRLHGGGWAMQRQIGCGNVLNLRLGCGVGHKSPSDMGQPVVMTGMAAMHTVKV